MTTARDICVDAFDDAGIIGVGQTPSAEDMTKALRRLNAMIAQWNRRRWLVYHLQDTALTGTGALSYTVGAAGDFNIPRPDSIESAFFRLLNVTGVNQVDYPLVPIRSREEYNDITLKNLATFPQAYFYDSGYPTGSLFVWPVPNNQYEIHISTKAPLSTFANLSDDFNFPPEYEEAMRTNLAVRLRIAYQLDGDPVLIGLAKVALNTIKNSNAQIPPMEMPADLSRPSLYNLYGDVEY